MRCTQKGQTYVGKVNKYRDENKTTTARIPSVATSKNNDKPYNTSLASSYWILVLIFPYFLLHIDCRQRNNSWKKTLPNHSEMVSKAPFSLVPILFGTQPIPLDGTERLP